MNDLDGVAPLAPSAQAVAVAIAAWTARGAQHWLPVCGQSMRPFLRDGDRVLVACGVDTFQRGDILVFRQGQRLIIHRLIATPTSAAPAHFVTCGDNQRRPDPPFTAGDILGRVVLVQRGARCYDLRASHQRSLGRIIALLQSLYLKARRRL